jgi:hypothetical protein
MQRSSDVAIPNQAQASVIRFLARLSVHLDPGRTWNSKNWLAVLLFIRRWFYFSCDAWRGLIQPSYECPCRTDLAIRVMLSSIRRHGSPPIVAVDLGMGVR